MTGRKNGIPVQSQKIITLISALDGYNPEVVHNLIKISEKNGKKY